MCIINIYELETNVKLNKIAYTFTASVSQHVTDRYF